MSLCPAASGRRAGAPRRRRRCVDLVVRGRDPGPGRGGGGGGGVVPCLVVHPDQPQGGEQQLAGDAARPQPLPVGRRGERRLAPQRRLLLVAPLRDRHRHRRLRLVVVAAERHAQARGESERRRPRWARTHTRTHARADVHTRIRSVLNPISVRVSRRIRLRKFRLREKIVIVKATKD